MRMRRRAGPWRAAAAMIAVLSPIELAGCAQPSGTTFDYAELAADTRTACTVLSAQADALVAAGRLDPARVNAAEDAARLAVAALGTPLAARDASGKVAAFDLASLQVLARQARMALAALAALIPPGVLPGPVAVAIQIADALLDAFVAVTPLQARVTLVAAR